jgi:hypothetical protein
VAGSSCNRAHTQGNILMASSPVLELRPGELVFWDRMKYN